MSTFNSKAGSPLPLQVGFIRDGRWGMKAVNFHTFYCYWFRKFTYIFNSYCMLSVALPRPRGNKVGNSRNCQVQTFWT
jgi:hypothetical protein